MSLPRLIGMVQELQFAEPVPEDAVAELEDMDGPLWPEEAKGDLPFMGLEGRVLGRTRVVRAAVTPDRMALRVEYDLGDVATP